MSPVRPAVSGDAQRLAEIAVAGWHTAYNGIVPPDVLVRQTVERHITYWLDAAVLEPPMSTWVIETDGVVVGYARAGPYRHDDPGESPSIGELWGIHVDPDHWGNGYGQALMTVGIRQLRSAGYETAHLWVFRENARARRFYEASGWEADGAIKALQIGTPPPVLLEEVRYSRRIGAVQT